MFRHPLRPFLRFLMALLLSAAASQPALAVVDVSEVSFTVVIAKSTGANDDITAELRVTPDSDSDALNNGTVTPPGRPPIVLEDDSASADLVKSLTFNSEAQLALELPTGIYALSLNGGSVTANINYQRETVPSPAISKPEANETVPPGPVEVKFTACPMCNLNPSSVQGLLEQGTTVLASETLVATDDTWTPPDGMGADLQLAPESQFTATITSTGVLQANTPDSTPPVGDSDGFFGFISTFTQSDAVNFDTGFDAPSGTFCIVVNDLTPPPGCTALSDPLLSILDTSGVTMTSVAGHAAQYDIDVDNKGRITGTAMADLNEDLVNETTGEVRGKLRGKEGVSKQKLSFPLENEALDAKLKVKVQEELSIPGDAQTGEQKTTGKLGGVKIKEETPLNQTPLPVPAQGWQLDFTLGTNGVLESATLTLELGRSFDLVGTNKFKFATNVSNLKLETADKGIRIRFKKLGLDDTTLAVTGGDMSYKILGQSGRTTLP